MDTAGVGEVAQRALEQMGCTNDPFTLAGLALALAALAPRMEAREAALVTAQAAPRLLEQMGRTNEPFTLATLARTVAALATRMEAREAAAALRTAAARVLEAMSRTGYKPPPTSASSLSNRPDLATVFGALSEWMDSQDLATLLASHKLAPPAAEAVLRQLEPLARQRFKSIDEAVDYFSKAGDREPNDWQAWLGRGHVNAKSRQWTKAIDDYSKAIELSQKDWQTFVLVVSPEFALNSIWIKAVLIIGLIKAIRDCLKGH